MSRNTEKYQKAIEILGENGTQGLPNGVTYGRMMEKGYFWTGTEWRLNNTRYEVELEIRVSSYNPDDVLDTVDRLARVYRESGHYVNIRPPVLRDSGVWQAYVRVSN
jgi:hypothetical protein